LSLLAKDNVAVFIPDDEGKNRTVNVVELPAANVALGNPITVKSVGFAPEKVIVPMVRGKFPVF
jgi:hypothetical protein